LVQQHKETASYETSHNNNVSELTANMRGHSDSLKKKKVDYVKLESSVMESQFQKKLESYHEERWRFQCAPYDGLDPSTYASNKEAEQIRYRETELEMRFKKIYDETVAQMIEQSQQDQETAAEKKRKFDDEKRNLEAETKEMRSKRVQLLNDIGKGDGEITKANKEVQTVEAQIKEEELRIPHLEKVQADLLEKLKAVEVEMKTLAAKAELRENNWTKLRAILKEKQEQAASSKIEEDDKINELKESLQEKKRRLEEANIGLFPEISKYRGLVDVAEVKLTPQAKRKRTTM